VWLLGYEGQLQLHINTPRLSYEGPAETAPLLILVTQIQDAIEPPDIYTRFYNYNHARRLRLEKLWYYAWGFLEVPTDILNHFWIQAAVSLLKPPHGGFRNM
jgi:hypothetical protein